MQISNDFIARMDQELEANKTKGNWGRWNPTPSEWLSELHHHTAKLMSAIKSHDYEKIKEYSADIGLYAEKAYNRFGNHEDNTIPDEHIQLIVTIFKDTGKYYTGGEITIPWDDPDDIGYLPWSPKFNSVILEKIKVEIGGCDGGQSVVIADHPKYNPCFWYNRCYTRKIK